MDPFPDIWTSLLCEMRLPVGISQINKVKKKGGTRMDMEKKRNAILSQRGPRVAVRTNDHIFFVVCYQCKPLALMNSGNSGSLFSR